MRSRTSELGSREEFIDSTLPRSDGREAKALSVSVSVSVSDGDVMRQDRKSSEAARRSNSAQIDQHCMLAIGAGNDCGKVRSRLSDQ